MTASFADLLQLTHRFYYYLDEMRYKDLVALMREDGVWHRQGKVLKGHAQVLSAMEERPRSQRIRHIITNAFLSESDEKSATLIAYLTAYKFDDGKEHKPPVTISGPFRLLLVKKRFVQEGGTWRIAETAGTPEFEFK